MVIGDREDKIGKEGRRREERERERGSEENEGKERAGYGRR